MPLATVKVDYLFNDSTAEPAGWSETTYLADVDLTAALANATSDAYIVPRLSLLHPSYFLRAVRVSDIAIKGDSLVTVYPGNSGRGLYELGRVEGQPDDSEEPYDGLLIRLESGTRLRRMFILRGIPANIIKRNRKYQPEGQFINAFNTWKGAVTAGVRWNILQRTLTELPAPSGIGVFGDGRSLRMEFADGVPPSILPPSPTQAASVLKVHGESSAWLTNKNWGVRRIADDLVITRPGRRRIRGTPTLPIFLDLISYAPQPLTDAVPLEGRGRKTGRPSDLLHGRRAMTPA